MRSLLCSMLVFSLAAPVAAQTLIQVPTNGPIRGELSETDAQYAPGDFYDEYLFLGEAGATVTISLSSEAFDTFLEIFSLDMDFTIESDDIVAGSNLNSQLQTVLPISGPYYIAVTSYELYGFGPYTLTVSYTPPSTGPAPAQQPVAVPAPAGNTVQPIDQAVPACPAGTLFQNGSCVWQPPAPAVVCPPGMQWTGVTCEQTATSAPQPPPGNAAEPAPAPSNECLTVCGRRYSDCDRDANRAHATCVSAVGISGIGDAVNRQPGAWNEATDRTQGCLQAKNEADRFCREERMACEGRCP
jgi:hypothetical protein